ncbi:hypothetical protein T265_04962 [Opisthorchis viverrini]|uniref:PH domain protein n=1 Tax=Opisthorchis viverrini TaxID=6198 RepID=A0A075AFW0_OPIVI|nr:hypothetical protein T265_04962 [Opisthorchis viverrini]KER28124.1 hypothetical protein T265_04962 [Opisthorchis viverrini]
MTPIERVQRAPTKIVSYIKSLSEDPAERRRILGCQEFNNNPKQGLEYLFEQGLLERNPASVARFFVEEHERLSKVVLGTYLGEAIKSELYEVTSQIESFGFPVDCEDPAERRRILGCQEFNNNPKQSKGVQHGGVGCLYQVARFSKSGIPSLSQREFTDRGPNLTSASQLPLSRLGRPGSIPALVLPSSSMAARHRKGVTAERFLLHWSNEAYVLAYAAILLNTTLHNTNAKSQTLGLADEKVFVHEAYVLAYAAILLNTTLHNTNAKSQTLGLADEKVFVRTLLDYDRETDLPEDLIRKVYQDIKNEPIRAASDDGLDGISQNGKVLMKGWLLKLGGRVRSWKRRWFVLTENSLIYYTTPDRQRNVKGVIPLDGLSIRLSQERTKENSFELFSIRNEVIKASKADKDGSSAPGHHTTYRLAASTTTERDRWIRMLESVTHKIAERRGARSTSVDCTSGTGSINPRLSSRLVSASLKRSAGAGSHPDLPSQQSALNNH